jgi:hypothetical protein
MQNGFDVATFTPSEAGKSSEYYPNGEPVCMTFYHTPTDRQFFIASTAGPSYMPSGIGTNAWHDEVWKGCESVASSSFKRGPHGEAVPSPYYRHVRTPLPSVTVSYRSDGAASSIHVVN